MIDTEEIIDSFESCQEDNKMELKETLKNMKIGDVITIEFNDGVVDYITKTNWFETTVFVLGGLGRTGMPKRYWTRL